MFGTARRIGCGGGENKLGYICKYTYLKTGSCVSVIKLKSPQPKLVPHFLVNIKRASTWSAQVMSNQFSNVVYANLLISTRK